MSSNRENVNHPKSGMTSPLTTEFKRKTVSIIILGMQAVGKTTIALRLYKFKRALPDTNYVQTKGFNTYTVKRKKTTVNIYDLGGHPSIQELWDHYYADSHGVVFVVDTSKRETVPEAGQLLSKVLSDHRIRGKPVLLLANKVDLDGITESELDAMLNLQQLVNSVRCLTRLDVSCATDLKNDKGIFEGFTWLISYIDSNYHDINTRVLSDTMEEKNREKARREAVKAARDAEKAAEEEEENSRLANGLNPGSPLATSTPVPPPTSDDPLGQTITVKTENGEEQRTSPKSKPSSAKSSSSNHKSEGNAMLAVEASTTAQEKSVLEKDPPTANISSPRPISVTRLPPEPAPIIASKIPLPLLPPINHVNVVTPFVDQSIKLPRLKSPKSRPEIINRIEETGDGLKVQGSTAATDHYPPIPGSDQYYDEKGFKFRKISAARRMSPEGADSDDGIVNMAYEPSEDLSSDSTPIGVRKHNFAAGAVDGDLPNKELFMITTLAEVHKEYFKDRKGSTSTHDSVSMSAASMMSDHDNVPMAALQVSLHDDGQSTHSSLQGSLHNGTLEGEADQTTATGENKNWSNSSTPSSIIPTSTGDNKIKSKKQRLGGLKPRSNKTAPSPIVPPSTSQLSLANAHTANHHENVSAAKLLSEQKKRRTPTPKGSSGRMPFTVSNAWGSSEIPEHVETKGVSGDQESNKF